MSVICFLDFNTTSPSLRPEDFVTIQNASRTICLSPASDYWANQKGLNCESVDLYIDPAYLREKGIENYAAVESICTALDSILLSNRSMPQIDMEVTPGPTFGFYYKLKIILDALTIRNITLSNILKTYAPEEIYYLYDILDCSSGLEEVVFQNSHSLYFDLLSYLSDTKKFLFHPILVTRSFKAFTSKRQSLFTLPILRRALEEMLQMRRPKMGSKPSSHNLLIFSKNPDWNVALRLLVNSRGNKIFHLPLRGDSFVRFGSLYYYFLILLDMLSPDNKKQTVDKALVKKFLERILSLRNSFPIEDIYFHILVSFFQEVLLRTEGLYREGFQKTKSALGKQNISVIMTTFVADPENYMRIRAARELKIPVAVFQHGGVGFDSHSIYYWGETSVADHMFLYGTAVKTYYEKLSRNRSIHYHITGSPSMEALKDTKAPGTGFSKDARKCVYILNILAGNTHYLSHKNYQSDIYLWHFHKHVADIFAKRPDWSLIIKPHPSRTIHNPIHDYITERGMNNVNIDNEKATDDLMQAADLIIVDYPATSLIKAIAMKKEVMVFSGYFTIEKRLEARLSEMLYVSSRKEEFFEKVKHRLESGHSKVNDHMYDEFLSDYATYGNDGKSVMRIKDAIENIIFQNQRGIHA